MTAPWNTQEAIDARLDRARIMQDLRLQNVTKREIAKAFGITTVRVTQISFEIDYSIECGVWPDRLLTPQEIRRRRRI